MEKFRLFNQSNNNKKTHQSTKFKVLENKRFKKFNAFTIEDLIPKYFTALFSLV